MSLLSNLQLMSQYNQWMNQKIYQIAQQLGNDKIQQEQGAFFSSIFGTLNHIYVADIIWLRRFAQHAKQYPSLDKLPELASYTALNQTVADNIKTLNLEYQLSYTDTKGNAYQKNFGQLIHHFFNHQTHHRGQASTLISQQGLEVGVTDLLKIIPEQQDVRKSYPDSV